MAERKIHSEDTPITPFSTETLRNLHDLGLEAEDIKAIGQFRSSIHTKILSLIGNKDQRKIIRLEKRIRKEKATYLKTAESQLQDKIQNKTLIKKYQKFCEDDLEKWQFVIQHVLNQDETTIEAAIELVDEFGDDLEKWQKAIGIATSIEPKIAARFKERDREISKDDEDGIKKAVLALCKQKDAYQGDPEILEVYADLAQATYSVAEKTLKALAEARDIHNNEPEWLGLCVRILKTPEMHHGPYHSTGGFSHFSVFQRGRPIYQRDLDAAREVGDICCEDTLSRYYSEPIDALLEAKDIFEEDPERRQEFIRLAKKGGSKSGDVAIKLLASLQPAYRTGENFETAVSLVEEMLDEDPGLMTVLVDNQVTPKEDLAKVKTCVANLKEVKNREGRINSNLPSTIDLTNLDLLLATNTLLNTCQSTSWGGGDKNVLPILGRMIETHGQTPPILLRASAALKEIGAKVSNKGQTVFLEIYGTDVEKLEAVAGVVATAGEKGGQPACDALTQLDQLHQNSLEHLKFLEAVVSDISERLGGETVTALTKHGKVYGSDIEKLQKATKYAEATKIFDETVLAKFIEIFEQEGEAKAQEYLESLPSKAKGLIGSRIPEAHRALPEYQYLVRYAFPDGNYSTYEKNLGCGDRLEHVDRYEFDREGYPVVLTGLLGYKVKEDSEPDQELLGTYTERLGRIRQFVASRGPDNGALQKTFEEKIDRTFEEKAWPEFREITGLTLKEKMLCLFLGEAVRRKQKRQSSEPDVGICDLIVEYKYAFHEDLEAYVARSADSVKTYTDKASQDYMLLAELSVIYGENVKHVLRHNIFEELEESENYARIVEVFSEKLGGASENKDLTPKQWKRIDNTFSNERIPPEKKSEVLYKQVYGFFSSNIEFESDEQRQEFDEKLKGIFAELGDNLTLERFRELLPKFYKLRALYRSGINAQLTELFTYDINQIFEELAKYEENVEEEAKEKRMGGEKEKQSKKSAKKRNIRGYFTKTAETTNARMGAYLCIAGDTEMWGNENYFEMVLVDEETNKCVGVVMLLAVKGKDGKKYLWFGPNPFESFLDIVSSQACYQYLYERTCEFAEQNDFAGVVVPSKDGQILGQCTNRGGDFPGFIKASRLKDKSDNLIVVDFDKKRTLGGGYGYEDGALIWRKKKLPK